MRRVFGIVILLCVIYFVGGWIAVHFGLFDKSEYFSYAGIVGGLASVVGLLSLTKPALTKTDLQEIEMDSLISIAKTSEELTNLEAARAKTEEALGDLAVQKKEMELLVKKASLALFLKEQHLHHEKKILDEISKNDTLNESLDKIQEVTEKLSVLNEEIEFDPNVLQLKEIMGAASRRQPTFDETIKNMAPIQRLMFLFLRDLGRAVTNVVSVLK